MYFKRKGKNTNSFANEDEFLNHFQFGRLKEVIQASKFYYIIIPFLIFLILISLATIAYTIFLEEPIPLDFPINIIAVVFLLIIIIPSYGSLIYLVWALYHEIKQTRIEIYEKGFFIIRRIDISAAYFHKVKGIRYVRTRRSSYYIFECDNDEVRINKSRTSRKLIDEVLKCNSIEIRE